MNAEDTMDKMYEQEFFNKNYKGTDARNFGENIEESGYANLKTVNDLRLSEQVA